MFKENAPPPPQEVAAVAVSEDQRARITSNFRAAKALLARKRPPDLTPPLRSAKFASHLSLICSSFASCPLYRALNPSHPFLFLFRCSVIDASNPRCSPVVRVPLSDTHNGVEFRNGVSTPAKPLRVCQFQVKDTTLSSSILDEELDDSFLDEVDTICEQLSSVKKDNPNAERERDYDKEEEGSRSFTDDMPKKYYDYFQSLNDAQREAACTNISVPLMIVAGPGSGKAGLFIP